MLLTACSTEETKKPTLPSSLCGVQVDEEHLRPLLPPSDEYEEQGDEALGEWPHYCSLFAADHDDNKEQILFVRIYRDDVGFDPLEAAHPPPDGAPMLDIENPREIDVSGPAVIGVEGLIGRVQCYTEGPVNDAGRNLNDFIVFIGLEVETDTQSDADRVDLIEDFSRSYIHEFREQQECDA